jgi:hypothetical protein
VTQSLAALAFPVPDADAAIARFRAARSADLLEKAAP